MATILKLRNGFPSPTESSTGYIKACQREGFESAHRRFLIELKAWFDSDPEYAGKPYKIAEQADLFESAMTFTAREAEIDVPPIKELDIIFADVFGPAGAKIVAQKQAEADAAVHEFMEEEGITDEAMARRLLVDGMIAGMELFIEHGHEIGREANTMSQIEDIIGPVDWDDMGDE